MTSSYNVDVYDNGSPFGDLVTLVAMSTSPTGVGGVNASSRLISTSRLHRFSTVYGRYHGYLSLAVCAVGIVSSLLVVAVLTRRHMISSTNYMLTALALCDLLTMISYVPYAVQYYCRYGNRPSPVRDTLGWARFCFVYANVSVVAHTSSIWIAVALSAYRYSVVRRSTEGRTSFSGSGGAGGSGDLATSRFIVGAVCLSSALVLIPNYLTLTIVEQVDPRSNLTMYVVQSMFDRPEATVFDHFVGQLNFWVHALVVKLVPCVLMLVFGCLLVATVRRHSRHRKQLRTFCRPADGADRNCRRSDGSATACLGGNGVAVGGGLTSRLGTGGPRTTAMLISVIVLFLITEMPQGALALVCGVHRVYFDILYSPLGDLMDMVALVNNAINFVLYCTMSRQFRLTFWQLFVRPPPAMTTSLSATPLKSCIVVNNGNINGNGNGGGGKQHRTTVQDDKEKLKRPSI
jgi:uncharacterized membrane protein YgcG